jgi:hypothetical protein
MPGRSVPGAVGSEVAGSEVAGSGAARYFRGPRYCNSSQRAPPTSEHSATA